jgi:type I restriction enzyme S subunit
VSALVEFNALSELPAGWAWKPLQSLTKNPRQDVVDGPFGSDLKASEYVSEGVPIARLQNIDRNAFVTKNIRFLTLEKAQDLARHEFKPDDILITKLGDPLGKACIVPESIGRGVIVADLVRVRPDENQVDRRYLTYAINSPEIIKQFELHTKGTTRPRINLSVLRQLPIPVAPREVQGEIVAEIEKQFSRLDEAVANLQRVKANLKRYKAAILKAAVEGRLVETEASLAHREGRSYETGNQLLQRILEQRRIQWAGRGKYKEPEFLTNVSRVDIPEGWTWASLEQLHLQIADVDHRMPKGQQDGVPYVSTKDFLDDEGIDFAGAKRISSEDYEALCRKVKPERGDVLLSRYGTVGEVRAVTVDSPFQASYSVAILKPVRENFPVRFLIAALRSEVVTAQIKRDVRATAQPDLGLAHIRKFVVPLPPIGEQVRIVEELDRCLSVIREVEAEVAANLLRAHSLRKATLAKAFMKAD